MADQEHPDKEEFGAINFNEAVKRQQFGTLDGVAKMFGITADRQSSSFTMLSVEDRPMETAAARNLLYREAPISRSKGSDD